MFQKGFAPILIIITIVILTLIGGGIFYITNKQNEKVEPLISEKTRTPDPSSESPNWKLYANSELGFSIKYPSTWFTYDNETPPCINNFSNVLINKTQLKDCYTIDFKTTKEDFYVIVGPKRQLSDLGFLPSEPTKFNGEDGIKGYIKADTEGPIRMETFLYVNHNDKNYYLSFPNTDYQGTHDPIYDQILSSFKFLDSKTTQLNTFRDETYGFSISYDNTYIAEPITNNIEGVFYLCIYNVGGQAKPCTASVDVFENKDRLTLEQWANLFATPIQTYGGTAKLSKGTFNDYPAMLAANEAERVSYVSKGHYIYKIRNVADAPPAEIANTFKLTQ